MNGYSQKTQARKAAVTSNCLLHVTCEVTEWQKRHKPTVLKKTISLRAALIIICWV